MKKFDILYARNSNGSINQWAIEAYNTEPVGIMISEGIIDGTLTHTHRKSKGKNIGKMNETSDYEQACKEAESRWNLKKKKGYKSIDDLMTKEDKLSFSEVPLTEIGITNWLEANLPKNRTDANDLLKPMLALPMFDSKTGNTRAKFPMIGQPKINGFRMMCRWEKVWEGEGMFRQEVEKPVFRSRDGIRFETLEHIEAEFTKDMFFTPDGIDIVFDGELYYDGWLLQRINSAVNKRNSDTPNLGFVVFDLAIEEVIQSTRSLMLLELDNKVFIKTDFIRALDIYDVLDLQTAQKLTDKWIEEGYEGGIFRDPKSTYQYGKRSASMLKLKRFQDKEFLVLDVIGGDNAPELGIFVCKAENGEVFKVTPEGSHEIKKEYLTNKDNYIGKMLTVKFYERTDRGIPFHAVGLTIRENG